MAPVTPAQAELQGLAERSAKALYEPDRASQALGMRITSIAPQRCTVSMTVRADMTNGHAICHGGVIFTLADSAFAFACNSEGEATVAATASIDFLAAAREGDTLTAAAQELWRGGRSGIYEVTITNQAGTTIALFRGRSHRIGKRSSGTQDPP
jgi:acyl-CoA thioesterase